MLQNLLVCRSEVVESWSAKQRAVYFLCSFCLKELEVKPKFFKLVVCNPCRFSPSFTILVPSSLLHSLWCFFLSFINYRDFQISFNLKAILYLAKIALKLPWLSAVKTESFIYFPNPPLVKDTSSNMETSRHRPRDRRFSSTRKRDWCENAAIFFSLTACNIYYVRTWLRYKTLYSQSNKTRHLKRTPPLLFPTITPLNHPL